MLSATFPYPPTKGGTHNRTFNLLQPIALRHQVTLLTQRAEDVTEEDIAGLRQWVDELIIFPRPQAVKAGILAKIQRFGQFILKGTPPNVLFLYSHEMQTWIDDAVAAGKFEAITCEHSVNEIYIRPQWQQKLTTIIDIHSSIYRTCKNQLETNTSENPKRDRLFLPLLRRYEQQSIRKFSHVVVTTDEDEQQMRRFVPNAQVTVIPNGVDLDTFPYREKDLGGYNLVFVGGLDYFVNIDAACFFATEVFPQLQQQFPDATLTLVGSKPAPEVQALTEQNPAITVTGRVPSIAQYLHQATVAVAPLRTGFGMKIKTLEYMAAGTPVVGSDRGLEGIEVDSDRVPLRALRANTIEQYLQAIATLLTNPCLRAELASNARTMIEQEYTYLSLANRYEKIITGSYNLITDQK
ncbi:glycosyl transferase group 1 [Stanieria cyanosphaera PCC 7437]|uniref:Glycosyl transferase group 1 n=2 Tax=Stanieria cyanosphaera TaxID=102116 RepID=K9XST4_STAC7|nr:glycosyl transferase group 1 [Stanieria cyanosphaera PCC 7437]